MANELTVNILGQILNVKHNEQFVPGTLTFDQAAIGAHSPVVSVTTGEEVVAFGDIGTKGWIFGQNLDITNYIIWGPTSGSTELMVKCGRIEAGEPFAFRLEPTMSTLKWHSNTGTVKVKLMILED